MLVKERWMSGIADGGFGKKGVQKNMTPKIEYVSKKKQAFDSRQIKKKRGPPPE